MAAFGGAGVLRADGARPCAGAIVFRIGGAPFFTAEGFTVFFVKGFGAAAAHQFEHLVGHLVGKSKIPGPAIAQSKSPVKSNVFQNLGEKLGDGSGAG